MMMNQQVLPFFGNVGGLPAGRRWAVLPVLTFCLLICDILPQCHSSTAIDHQHNNDSPVETRRVEERLQRLLEVRGLSEEDSSFLRSLQISIGSVVFVDQCWRDLDASDTLEPTGELREDEFLAFAKEHTNGLLDNITTYDEIPIEFAGVFNQVSCFCNKPLYGGDPDDTMCCVVNPSVRVTTFPDENQSQEDFLYLYMTCALTDAAARSYQGRTESPTLSPTSTPEPTTLPPVTATPTTPAPTTSSPVETPTATTALPPSSATSGPPSATAPSATTEAPPSSTTAGPPSATAPSATTDAPPTAPSASSPPTQSVTVSVTYDIAVADGGDLSENEQQNYLSDLILGMDRLVSEVEVELNSSRRRLGSSWNHQRRLVLSVDIPTRIQSLETIDCVEKGYGTLTTGTDVCQSVTAEFDLEHTDETAEEAEGVFEAATFQSIYDGELQRNLDTIDPESPVTILTGVPVLEPRSSSGLSAGGIAGITIGAVAFPLALMALFLATRSRPESDREAKGEVLDLEDGNSGAAGGASLNSDNAVVKSSVGSTAADRAVVVNEDEVAQKLLRQMEAGEDLVAEPGMENRKDRLFGDEHSSDAGNSGWSSSAGASSYNTGSLDDNMDSALAQGAVLAALSPLPSKSRNQSGTVGADTSRAHLETLIDAGDWAAVGATAALLAAASDSRSRSTGGDSSRDSRSSSRSRSMNEKDEARAAELDALVEAGDWEGVVLAASRFDDEEKSRHSSADDSNEGSTIDGTSASGTSASGTASKSRSRAEVRKEVEELVRRVVPDEIDNVDEMMNQFKGREEELVETLRTMQERAVAQKARAAGQKQAKVEARMNVQRGVVPGASRVADRIATLENQSATSGSAEESAISEARTALELAIERGDWDAVSEAAAMISGSSSSSDAQKARLPASPSRSKAQRARELNVMIDKQDWKGVMAAANQFSAADQSKSVPKRSKEEEEALAQAELWMRIAEQKKKEGKLDANASEAAEWAIQRSLSQMKDAEKSAPETTEEDEV